MAMNLFTKTYLAAQSASSSSSEPPEFLICEQSEKNADAFLNEIRQKGGEELARRVRRVGSGKESASLCSIRYFGLHADPSGWLRPLRVS